MLFGDNGYVKFNYDEQIVKWANCAREIGSEILANPCLLYTSDAADE